MAAIAIATSLVAGLAAGPLRLSRFPLAALPGGDLHRGGARPAGAAHHLLHLLRRRAGGLGLNPFGAGALALALYTSAMNAEIVRAGITSIERGQLEASRSLGLSYLQTMRYVVLPQALRRSCPRR